VATELLQRWGYKKTTIDDIAKQAGVAKGTIYLHWKTREDLFNALIMRESVKLAEDIQRRIANDPEGVTLHGMIKHATLATMQRPLWKAVLTRDTELLGELTHSFSDQAIAESATGYQTYLELLQRQGLVRSDITIRDLIHMLSAISMGFLLVEPFLPDELKLPDEQAAELMAETIRRTFEPREPASPNELQAASQALHHYFEHTLTMMKEQDYKEL